LAIRMLPRTEKSPSIFTNQVEGQLRCLRAGNETGERSHLPKVPLRPRQCNHKKKHAIPVKVEKVKIASPLMSKKGSPPVPCPSWEGERRTGSKGKDEEGAENKW